VTGSQRRGEHPDTPGTRDRSRCGGGWTEGRACVPRDTVVVAEGGQWVADGMVNPGAAQFDRRTGEIDGVQPAADAIAGFEHGGVMPA